MKRRTPDSLWTDINVDLLSEPERAESLLRAIQTGWRATLDEILEGAERAAASLEGASDIAQADSYAAALRRTVACARQSFGALTAAGAPSEEAVCLAVSMAELGLRLAQANTDAKYAMPAHVGRRVLGQVGSSKHPGDAELAELLRECRGNKSEVARRLGVTVRTVGRWINGK